MAKNWSFPRHYRWGYMQTNFIVQVLFGALPHKTFQYVGGGGTTANKKSSLWRWISLSLCVSLTALHFSAMGDSFPSSLSAPRKVPISRGARAGSESGSFPAVVPCRWLRRGSAPLEGAPGPAQPEPSPAAPRARPAGQTLCRGRRRRDSSPRQGEEMLVPEPEMLLAEVRRFQGCGVPARGAQGSAHPCQQLGWHPCCTHATHGAPACPCHRCWMRVCSVREELIDTAPSITELFKKADLRNKAYFGYFLIFLISLKLTLLCPAQWLTAAENRIFLWGITLSGS